MHNPADAKVKSLEKQYFYAKNVLQVFDEFSNALY